MRNIYSFLNMRTLLNAQSLYTGWRSLSSSISSTGLATKMRRLIDARQFREALALFNQQPLPISNDPAIILALKASANICDYQSGTRIHRQLSNEALANPRLQTSLIHFYMCCNDIDNAEKIFASSENKNVFMHGALFKGYIRNGKPEKVIEAFKQMPVEPNAVIINLLLNACAKYVNAESIRVGKETLRRLPSNFLQNPYLVSSAINTLMKFREVEEAERVFGSAQNKDMITYGAMMKGYLDNNMPSKALELVDKIEQPLDDIVLTLILSACTALSDEKAMQLGNKLYRQITSIETKDLNTINAILTMLMKFEQVKDAEELFQSLQKKDQITLGAMMKGYVDNGMPERALDLFEQMREKPNNVLYIIIFGACAALGDGRAIELGNKLLRQIPMLEKKDIILIGSALNMMMKLGQIEEAEHLFAKIENRNVHVYGIMMHGYNYNEKPQISLKLFEDFKREKLVPNAVIFLALIAAAGQIGIRSICETVVNEIHLNYRNNLQLKNALIDMWGKALVPDEAEKLFRSLPQPNAFTYGSMINAYARSGMGLEAVVLYQSMPETMRDSVSQICVLNACSHAGLVDQAQKIYEEINPKTLKIVTAMIDCLSRMFMFNEALNLITEYERSHPPSPAMYMAILSGARSARRSALAKTLYDRMQSLFPDHRKHLISASILLSNTYRSIGEKEQATTVRNDGLKNYGEKMKVGVTWTVVDGKVWEFKAHDTSHPRSADIYAKLDEILMKMREHGYEPDRSWITRSIQEDETPESVLCGHSEKLAIAFNLLQEPQPSVIHLSKNLRICGDCHNASKLIAKIYQCEIVARDTNRGHHFNRNGQCSCLDHF